jgi:cobalt-zinc-cadmium efflux system membrane fusion protein
LTKITFLLIVGLTMVLHACSAKNENLNNKKKSPDQVLINDRTTRAVGIQTDSVQKRDLKSNRILPGKIEPDISKEVDVSSRVSGRIDKLFVIPGQSVVRGQNLVSITSKEVNDLESEVLIAQAKVETAKAQESRQQQVYLEQVNLPKALMEAESYLKHATAQKNLTESQWKRTRTLYEEKIAPQKDLVTAKAALEHAETEFEQAKANLKREQVLYKNKAVLRGPYQLAQAERIRADKELQALKSQLQFLGIDSKTLAVNLKNGNNLGVLMIVAPIKGIVSFFEVAPGELIVLDKPIFRLLDLSTVLISADVPESEISTVGTGKDIRIKVPGNSSSFKTIINMVSSHVDLATRTLKIRARLENPKGLLKPGMFVEVKLEDSSNVVLSVPKSAVQTVKDRKVVFVHTDEGFEEKTIQTGIENTDFVEILSGVAEGSEVATQGSLMLKAELSSKYND